MHSRIARGLVSGGQVSFTIGKKLKLTIIALVYLVSPVDVVPDLLLPFGVVDDGVVLFLLVKVLCSPTVAPASLNDHDNIIDTTPTDAVPVRNTAQGTTR